MPPEAADEVRRADEKNAAMKVAQDKKALNRRMLASLDRELYGPVLA